MSVLCAAAVLLASCVSATQPSSAARELAPTGKLRAGINFGNSLLTKRDAGGGRPGGVAIDVAREMAHQLGVPLEIVAFDGPGAAAEAAPTNAWDIVFIAAGPERAATIDFSPPYVQIEATYLVPAASPIRTVDDADRAGVRIGVTAKTAYELRLTRTLRHAEIIRTASTTEAVKLMDERRIDAVAGVRQFLEPYEAARPGARVLAGNFGLEQQAIGTPKGRAAAVRFVHQFVEEIKSSGWLARAIDNNKVRGLSIAPATP